MVLELVSPTEFIAVGALGACALACVRAPLSCMRVSCRTRYSTRSRCVRRLVQGGGHAARTIYTGPSFRHAFSCFMSRQISHEKRYHRVGPLRASSPRHRVFECVWRVTCALGVSPRAAPHTRCRAAPASCSLARRVPAGLRCLSTARRPAAAPSPSRGARHSPWVWVRARARVRAGVRVRVG